MFTASKAHCLVSIPNGLKSARMGPKRQIVATSGNRSVGDAYPPTVEWWAGWQLAPRRARCLPALRPPVSRGHPSTEDSRFPGRSPRSDSCSVATLRRQAVEECRSTARRNRSHSKYLPHAAGVKAADQTDSVAPEQPTPRRWSLPRTNPAARLMRSQENGYAWSAFVLP